MASEAFDESCILFQQCVPFSASVQTTPRSVMANACALEDAQAQAGDDYPLLNYGESRGRTRADSKSDINPGGLEWMFLNADERRIWLVADEKQMERSRPWQGAGWKTAENPSPGVRLSPISTKLFPQLACKAD
jgi:hypothetical protein